MRTTINLLIGLCVAMALLCYTTLAFTLFQHDDFMYPTTAMLLGQYGLYTDLPFLQMPLLVWLQAGVFALVGPLHAYAALSYMGMAFGLLAMLALSLFTPTLAGLRLLVFVALLGAPALLMLGAVPSNHAPQLLLASLLLLLLVRTTPTPKTAALAGGLLGLLVLVKLNSLPLALPVLVWLWPAPQRWRCLLTTAAVGFVVMLPFLWLLWQQPAEVWFNNVTAPLLNNEQRGSSYVDTLPAFASLLGLQFLSPMLLALVFLTLGMAWWRARHGAFAWAAGLRVPLVFLLSVLLAGCLPGKLFHYHVALPVAAAVVVLAMVLAALKPPPRLIFLAGAVAFVLMVQGWVQFAETQPDLGGRLERFTAIREGYLEVLQSSKVCTDSIVTASALPVLAGPLKVLPASSAGPFLLRVAGQVPEPFRHWVDPAVLLAQKPALLTGFYTDMPVEGPLIAEAKRLGYSQHALGEHVTEKATGPWSLWLPPCLD